mgnify:FL=1
MTKTNNFRILLLMLVSIVLSIMPTLYADGKVIMLHPHERITNPKDTIGAKKVFLAGTIDMGSSVDWQKGLVQFFETKNGKWILFNPRQDKWDGTKKGEMDYQVNWELSHLEESSFIIMNILGTSKSPVSLLELGLFARSGKMAVVCDSTFYRYDNVRITCKKYGIHLYPTLDALLRTEFK